jgi:hypothetical protein
MDTPQLYDTIELLTDLPEYELLAGSRGAIVHQHSPEWFEVEFANADGETVALCALSAKQMVVVWRAATATSVSVPDQIAQLVTNLSDTSREEVRDFAQFLSIKEQSTSYNLS